MSDACSLVAARKVEFKRLQTKRCPTLAAGLKRGIVHSLSYTAVLWNFLPVGSVPLTVTVRVLPSGETVMRPLIMILPPFLAFSPSVWTSLDKTACPKSDRQ